MLKIGDATAAIIAVDDLGYLMQLRDSLPEIWYPGHWGVFGGGIEPGESEIEALHRELGEELQLTFDRALPASRLTFHVPAVSDRTFVRAYYEIQISAHRLPGLVLGEGAAMRVVAPSELFSGAMPVAPYDAFALFLHHSGKRISASVDGSPIAAPPSIDFAQRRD